MSAESPSRVTAAAQIGEVRLLQGSAKRRIRHTSEVGDDAELTIGHGGRVKGSVGEDGTFIVVAGVEAVVAAPAAKKQRPYITVKATFEVSYRLPQGFTASDDELAAFANVNGVFNVWPYCREFIQSMTTRMGLPPITLPLYRASDGSKVTRHRQVRPSSAAKSRESQP